MRTKPPRSKSTPRSHDALVSGGRAWKRRALSVVLLLHLLAVAAAPFAFAAAGPNIRSPVAYHVIKWLRPYIQFAFLDHGYFFFAPNPGPSHVMRMRAKTDDGREVVRIFPDRHRDFPRLLYHRHFMLSEQMNAMFIPPTPPPVPEASIDYRQWESERRAYEARRNSFLAHLKWRYDSDHVQLTRVEHRPATPDEVLDGMRLTDPSLYEDLPERPDPELIYPEVLP